MIRKLIIAIQRRLDLILFKLRCPSVRLDGKGLFHHIRCANRGQGNSINLQAGSSLQECQIVFKGNNNILKISSCCHFRGIEFFFEDDNNIIEIGSGTSIESGGQIAVAEGKRITLGDDCMLANQVYLRTTDSHSILDAEGNRINKGSDIIIGQHVWIGFQSLILKGSSIPDNCIVGARSIITASLKVDQNSLIAGSPAKVLRTGISWCRDRV